MSDSCCSACSVSESAPLAGSSSADSAGKRARRSVRWMAVRFCLSAVFFIAAITISRLFPAVDTRFVDQASRMLLVLSWLFAGYPVVYAALRNLFRGRIFDENFLMTIATAGAFAIDQWPEAAAVMLFYNLGELVQESAVARSRRSITELMDVRADFARVVDGQAVHLAAPNSVPVGTVVQVNPGEKIPLDGIVLAGRSAADTSRLTGESVPREIESGDEVLAGFINLHGLITIRTTRPLSETAAERMLNLIENSRNRKARAERMITSFARVYTPLVTLAAVVLAVAPPLLAGASWSTWIGRALVFLVISCPCAFVISVPLGYFGGIGGAARAGILVKGAEFMDVLARAGGVVFDKTGTLTKGDFTVLSVRPVSGVSREQLLSLALTAEAHSSHPVAAALRKHAQDTGVTSSSLTSGRGEDHVLTAASEAEDYVERSGFGVLCRFGGQQLAAGSARLMRELGVGGMDSVSVDEASAGTAILIALNGTYQGEILLGDRVKEGAGEAVALLHRTGAGEISLLSGDREASVAAAARQAGIGEWKSGVLPHEKVEWFEKKLADFQARRKGKTLLFVGDGINDAAVLARADAGIAMGGIGSDAAIEAADVVLMTDNPASVPEAILRARRTRLIVTQNIALSFIVKLAFLVLGAFGVATLWEAVFADVGVALLATLNALRARRL